MYTFDYLFLFGVHPVLLASTCRHLLQYWIIWMRSGLYRPTGLLFSVSTKPLPEPKLSSHPTQMASIIPLQPIGHAFMMHGKMTFLLGHVRLLYPVGNAVSFNKLHLASTICVLIFMKLVLFQNNIMLRILYLCLCNSFDIAGVPNMSYFTGCLT